MLPFEHALELQKNLPHARLLELKGVGHEIHPMDWNLIIEAIAEHTRQTASNQ